MKEPIIQRPEIDPRTVFPRCFSILTLEDARPLLHFAGKGAACPVSLTMNLSFEGPVSAPYDNETIINLVLEGAPRAAMELLPPENGYRAIADISGANCVALAKWLCEIFDHPMNSKALSVEEGVFASDAPDQPGYETAKIEASIPTSLLHHIRSLSNHHRIGLSQVEAIRYLRV